jgi:hypothetical protein
MRGSFVSTSEFKNEDAMGRMRFLYSCRSTILEAAFRQRNGSPVQVRPSSAASVSVRSRIR